MRISTYQQRKKLAELLPLDTPLSVHVCPTTFCNFKCQYCVHSLSTDKELPSGLKKQFMDISTFDLLIEQLKEFPNKLKLLNFAYLGEPLLHKDIAEMVRMAKEADIAERVEIVSNASMLTEELSKNLVDAGLSRLRVSIQGLNDDEYFEMSKAKDAYGQIKENLKKMYEISQGETQIYIKTVDAVVKTEERREMFLDTFEKFCDNINIESLIPISDECDISNLKETFKEGFFGNEVQMTHVCSEVFFTMVITPQGDVYPCCTMGKPAIVLGNIRNSKLYDIWTGEKLKALRIAMLEKGYEQFNNCQGCGVPMYQTAKEDYLDEYIPELLKCYREEKGNE